MSNYRIEKYQSLLTTIKSGLDSGKSLVEIRRGIKGSAYMYQFLIKNAIIIGSRNKAKWNHTIPVTYKLAETVYKGVVQYSVDYYNRKPKELSKKKTSSKPVLKSNSQASLPKYKSQTIKTKEFTLFWGLLKIKY